MSDPASSELPGKDEFARLMADRYRAGGGAELRYDADRFCLRGDGEPNLDCSLSSAYREYCVASPENRPAVVERYVGAWLARDKAPDPALADVLPNLLPMVRARTYFEQLRLRHHSDGKLLPQFPYRIIGEHYALGLMFIRGELMSVVAPHHLEEWKADLLDLLDSAADNLRARSERPFQNVSPGRVWMGHWGDNFGPSRLMFPGPILACEVRGEPVVVPANRDVLLLTGSDDPEGLLAVANFTEQAAKEHHPVGCLPLRLVDDDWVPFLPPSDTPAGVKFRGLWYQSRQNAYQAQAGHLPALYRERGEEVDVADYHYHPPGEGNPPFSFCVWSQGADVLLPEAGQVLFAVPDDRGEMICRAQVSLARALEIVGDLMEPQDLYPERWRVRTFPDAARLDTLREVTGT